MSTPEFDQAVQRAITAFYESPGPGEERVRAVLVAAMQPEPCETCDGTGRIRYTSTHEAGGVIHHDNSCPQKCLDGLGPLPYILDVLGVTNG